jgi:hypothetical protein
MIGKCRPSCLRKEVRRKYKKNTLHGFYSVSELYRSSGSRLSAKLAPTFADIKSSQSAQQVPTSVNLGFVDRSRYFFVQVAPQLSSRGRVDPVPDPLLLRKCGSAGNRTRDSHSIPPLTGIELLLSNTWPVSIPTLPRRVTARKSFLMSCWLSWLQGYSTLMCD